MYLIKIFNIIIYFASEYSICLLYNVLCDFGCLYSPSLVPLPFFLDKCVQSSSASCLAVVFKVLQRER